jgi:hypothetical protein
MSQFDKSIAHATITNKELKNKSELEETEINPHWI